MAIKVTKRHTGEYGCTYSISGLTFSQLFRVKNAMFDCEEKMKEIADQCAKVGDLAMAREFKEYARDAHEVFTAANDGCI